MSEKLNVLVVEDDEASGEEENENWGGANQTAQ